MKKLLVKTLFIVLIGHLFFSCSPQEEQVSIVEWSLPQGGSYLFTAINDDVIQVRFTNDSIASDLVHAPARIGSQTFTKSESKGIITLKTATVTVEIEKQTGEIRYKTQEGLVKLVDKGGLNIQGDTTFYQFGLEDGEAIYGTGFRALPLNRRGNRLLAYNRPQYGYGWGEQNLNYTFPHWTSSNNYGLLIDNPSRAVLDLGMTDKDQIIYGSRGGNLSYYFINGGNQKELLMELADLTGKQSLPPRWAFGNLQSRFGYRNREQAETILAQAIAADYPVDGIILDIYWFGPELEDGQMGRLDWDLEKWPDPKEMIAGFESQGVKTILVTEPFFTRKSKHYQYLSENKFLAHNNEGNTYDIPDFYFGVGGLLDVFKPGAKAWMWNQYKYIRSFGVDGLWVDLGEPEKHPHDMVHVNGRAHEVHGVYSHEWAKMIYEGYKKDYPNERLFHMGRSGFVGTQRYGLIPWTGDVGRGWNGFKAQIPAILSMGMSGLGYMHSDAGGFSWTDQRDSELYIRWLQFATFTSIFRPHADEILPPEPVTWDQKTQEIVKPLIGLRYSLLPYHYTLAYENSQTGLPFVRPMIMEFEKASDTLYQQFMYGNDMLVAPVVGQGETQKEVYLPEGDWYLFDTKKKIDGGKTIQVGAPLEKIPVFVKAGAVIPTSPDNRHAGSYTGEELVLTYYVGDASTSSKVYFDDGNDPLAIEEGKFEILACEVRSSESGRVVSVIRSGSYSSQPEIREITFKIIGLSEQPESLPDGANWDSETNTMTLQFKLSESYEISFSL